MLTKFFSVRAVLPTLHTLLVCEPGTEVNVSLNNWPDVAVHVGKWLKGGEGVDFSDATPVSFLCAKALREPAAFSKSTGCDSEIPHEKVTLAQARRGTPGH